MLFASDNAREFAGALLLDYKQLRTRHGLRQGISCPLAERSGFGVCTNGATYVQSICQPCLVLVMVLMPHGLRFAGLGHLLGLDTHGELRVGP